MMSNYCKICFKKIADYSLYNLVNKKNVLCEECFDKLDAEFITFRVGSIRCTSIYEYTEFIKELIYKYKGCCDYELKDVFLYRYINYLRIIYRGYYVVPVPSYYVDDEKRGFNHVVEIFNSLKLKMLPIIRKIEAHKQSSMTYIKRFNVSKLFVIDNMDLKDKKILLVDDIFTTGSTIMSCIDLLKLKGAKKIEVLVIAKTKKKEKQEY